MVRRDVDKVTWRHLPCDGIVNSPTMSSANWIGPETDPMPYVMLVVRCESLVTFISASGA